MLLNLSVACLDYVDSLIEALEALTAPPGERWSEQGLRMTRALASRFIGPASLVGLADLETAADGLCRLVDALDKGSRSDREPVRAYVEAMRLLRLPEAVESRADLLAALDGFAGNIEHETAALSV